MPTLSCLLTPTHVHMHIHRCGYRAVPESILLRMVRAHFRKPSSTFSPVRALVSRNISSMGRGDKPVERKGNGEKGRNKK